MKALAKLNLQVRAVLVAITVISTVFVLMINVYGFFYF